MKPGKLVMLGMLVVAASAASLHAQIGAVQTIAPGVYFHEGDPRFGTCNNGWVVMGGYVVVVDANYPMGARVVIPKIREITKNPVRFVIDTHFHPDHSFGNQVWVDAGAIPVAQENAFDELMRSGQAAWDLAAKTRGDMAATKLALPGMVYSKSMAFDDGTHRVELHWPGVAHTHGDTLVWLPRERILFTGDVCVNGSFNYVHDSDIGEWIKVLEAAKAMGAVRVCPGHGPLGGPEVIADQEGYFVALMNGVRALVDSGKTRDQVLAAAPDLAAGIRKKKAISRYVPSDFYFAAHVEKAYAELMTRTAE